MIERQAKSPPPLGVNQEADKGNGIHVDHREPHGVSCPCRCHPFSTEGSKDRKVPAQRSNLSCRLPHRDLSLALQLHRHPRVNWSGPDLPKFTAPFHASPLRPCLFDQERVSFA